MVGFLFRLIVVLTVLGVVALIFEFRWAGGELRVRNRWTAPEIEAPAVLPSKPQEAIPEESRRQVERIIEEAE